jgi:hypothetical protein
MEKAMREHVDGLDTSCTEVGPLPLKLDWSEWLLQRLDEQGHESERRRKKKTGATTKPTTEAAKKARTMDMREEVTLIVV